MNKYDHGGDVYDSPRDLLDFSANISPLGVPPGVVEALREAAPHFDRYPDPRCGKLREALGLYHPIDPRQIVCGNGAADLIHRTVRYFRPRKALLALPSFSEYEKALEEEGCELIPYFFPRPRFEGDSGILSLISDQTEILFLCNPNNPTGLLWDREILERIIAKCRSTNTVLVIDECFNEFLDDPAENSAIGFLGSAPKLIILKAFTKIYAMAGFRLGYILCGSEETSRGIARTGQPWSVSSIAQTAGIAALKETRYVEEVRRLVKTERKIMKAAFTGLGLEVLGGEANYIFFRITETSGFEGSHFFASLRSRGFLLRNCANYPGLDDSYYRVSLRRPGENQGLIRALQALRRGNDVS
jgi:threonine-phosphate decarboxylase